MMRRDLIRNEYNRGTAEQLRLRWSGHVQKKDTGQRRQEEKRKTIKKLCGCVTEDMQRADVTEAVVSDEVRWRQINLQLRLQNGQAKRTRKRRNLSKYIFIF